MQFIYGTIFWISILKNEICGSYTLTLLNTYIPLKNLFQSLNCAKLEGICVYVTMFYKHTEDQCIYFL